MMMTVFSLRRSPAARIMCSRSAASRRSPSRLNDPPALIVGQHTSERRCVAQFNTLLARGEEHGRQSLHRASKELLPATEQGVSRPIAVDLLEPAKIRRPLDSTVSGSTSSFDATKIPKTRLRRSDRFMVLSTDADDRGPGRPERKAR